MKRIFALLLLLGGVADAEAQTAIETRVRPPQGWSLGLSAGGSAFSDFQRMEMSASRIGPGGAVEVQEFPRRVGAKTTSRLAGSLAYWPSRNWGLRFYAAYSPTRFQTIISRSAAEFTGTPRMSSDTARLAALRITSFQLQSVFRMPTIHGRVMPYGLAGGGIVHYNVPNTSEPLPQEVVGQFGYGSRQQVAASLGIGALLQTRRDGWGLNFELLDQLSPTPVTHGPVNIVNSVSFTVGLSWLLSGR